MRRYGVEAFNFEVFLELGTAAEAKLAEMYCITGFKTNCRREGHWGYNLTDGGEGTTGCVHTAEARIKIGAAKRGKPSPLRGVPKNPEAIAKTAAAHRGRKRSPETRAKLSIAKLGKSRASSGPLIQSHKDQIRATLLNKNTKRKRIRDRILLALTSGPFKANDLLSTVIQAESEPTSIEYARNILSLLKKEGKVVQMRFGFYEL